MAEHLEVLGDVPGGRFGIVEGTGEADALDGRLGDALDDRRRLDPQRFEHRRYHVDGVSILRAHLTLCLDATGPVDDERVADAATIGLAFPAAEGCVAGPGPAPWVVVEGLRPTQLVQLLQALLERLGCVVEELQLIGRACGATLR